MKPLVSVIIVTYNKKELVRKSLSSLANSSYKNLEIIVVDNASTDGTDALIRTEFPNVKYLYQEKNLYFAEGNNKGYENATGKYIFLLNNDAYVEVDAIEKMVDLMEINPNAFIVQNKILKLNRSIDSIGSSYSPFGFLIHHYSEKKIQKPHQIFSAKGASMMIRCDFLKEQPYLFNSNYLMYFEDTDLCWRAYIAGGEVYYLPNSITHHEVGGSANKSNIGIIDYHSFKNRIFANFTNLSLFLLLFIFPIHILTCSALILIYSIKNRVIAFAILKAIVWNISHIKLLFRTRGIIQSTRVVSDFTFLPKLTISPTPLYLLNFINAYSKRKLK